MPVQTQIGGGGTAPRNLGATRGRVDSTAFLTLYSQERPSAVCAEGQMGLGIGVDGHENTLPKPGFDPQSFQPE